MMIARGLGLGLILCMLPACRDMSNNPTTPRFVGATVVWQHELEMAEVLTRIEPVEVTVTRQEDVERLANFFSEEQMRAETPLNAIISLATIRFVRQSGERVHVQVYPAFGGWSCQRASWPLPAEFAPYFIELCQRLQREQSPVPPTDTSPDNP